MKKTQTTIALAAVGVLAVGLLGYKAYSSGSLGLPASILAMTPWAAKTAPFKREFPSHIAEASLVDPAADAMAAEGETSASAPENLADSAGSAGQVARGGEPSPAAGISVGLAENVDSRIARATEMSKILMDDAAKPGPTTNSSATSSTGAANAAKPAAQGVAAYVGEWTGEYLGPDSGTVSVTVDPDGTAHGQGLSAVTSIGFSLAGKVSATGQVDLTKSAAGVTSTGGVFRGSMSNTGQAKGTWFLPAFDLSGTWQLHARISQ